tara:strand:- start:2534 stop:2803 length:270 start_codon:yes stop_codon:yes gene_type:complete
VDTNIDEDRPLVTEKYGIFKGANGLQPGDPKKGAERVIDTVKSEGLAAGKKLPQTLYLGSDVIEQARKRAEDTLALLKEWEKVGSKLNI